MVIISDEHDEAISCYWFKLAKYEADTVSAKDFKDSEILLELLEQLETSFERLEGVFKPSFCNFSQHIPNHSQIN